MAIPPASAILLRDSRDQTSNNLDNGRARVRPRLEDPLRARLSRFTEGFDLPDLKEAMALLNELGGRPQ